jgi:hypothetical protein
VTLRDFNRELDYVDFNHFCFCLLFSVLLQLTLLLCTDIHLFIKSALMWVGPLHPDNTFFTCKRYVYGILTEWRTLDEYEPL